MRGNASRFPDKQLSVAAARAQFQMWLASATPHMIALTTVDQLCHRYRLPEKELECGLLAKQAAIRRAAMVAPI